MNLLNVYERFLIILLPLVIPIIWWLTSPTTSFTKVLMVIFVLQIIVAYSLFLIGKKKNIITSSIQTQSQHSADEKFISLYERSPMPYIVINRVGEIVMFNPSAIRLFKANSDSLMGLNLFDMVSVDDENNLSVIMGKVDSGVTVNEVEIKLKTTTGDFRWVSLSVYISEVRDQRLVSLLDITQEKIVDTAKSEFVALATHQLRTPISAIRWNLELLQKNMKDTQTEAQTRYMTKIERNTMRMIALINDFLSVSKLEMGTFATSIEEVNLANFFNSIIDEYSEKITEKNLNLKYTYLPDNLTFKSDSRLLHIAISNLMSNAVKYVGVDGVDGVVSLNYELIDKTIIITVTDNGIGIPEGELDKLFSKFYRATNAQSHQAEGTGLGLYIVKQSVEKLGGGISVNSAENKGATFTIKLPIERF